MMRGIGWRDGGRERGGTLSLAVSTVVLGALAGCGASLLIGLLEGVEHVAGAVTAGAPARGFGGEALWRLVVLVCGAAIAGLCWWMLRRRSPKVPSVGQAVGGERMPVVRGIVHVLLQMLIVGTGSSIGREVAPRELGALLAQRYCSALRMDADRTRLLVAVSASAGLAGVYDAPLAGTMFAVEIVLCDVGIRTVGVALGASATAAFVTDGMVGRHSYYDIAAWAAGPGGQFPVPPNLVVFAVICGMVCGVMGAAFRWCASWAGRHAPRGLAVVWLMPSAALLTGVVAIWLPQVTGNGQMVAQAAFSVTESFSLTGAGVAGLSVPIALMALMAAKAVLTVATIGSGASGGVLQPGIALGACVGALLGCGWVVLFPGSTVLPMCALIGAAALLSASQQAPLMALCLVMELTEAPIALAVPAGLAVMAAAAVSRVVLDARSRSQRKISACIASTR